MVEQIIERENYRDYNGNEIGTEKNLVGTFADAILKINMRTNNGLSVAVGILNAVSNYKAVKYCYNNDTSVMDDKLNKSLELYFNPFYKNNPLIGALKV